MTGVFTESIVEDAALAWLESIVCLVRNGAEMAPSEPASRNNRVSPMLISGELLVKDAEKMLAGIA